MPIPTVTVVHAPACHFCADAFEALTALAHEVPIRIDAVASGDPTGLALVDAFRPAMFPLVLVDGEFFSQGRLPRRKLRARLEARTAVSPR